MKTYYKPSPVPNGGFPIFADHFIDCVQSEVYRAICAQYKALNEPVIIYGCQVTNIDTLGSTCDIAAGLAFLDGQIIDVPQYSGSYPVYLVQGDPVNETKLFKDQQPRTVMITTTTRWSNADAEAGFESILFDPRTSQYLADVQRRIYMPLTSTIWFPANPDAACFNANGIGKWNWLGFAIANGYGGQTTNLKGRVLAQYDPANPQWGVGATPGALTYTLQTNNLPDFSINITGQKGGKPAFGGGLNGYWASSDTSEVGATVNYTGGKQAFGIVQPTAVGVMLQRIAY